MTYRGRVKNGVIVLEDDTRLPEDAVVFVDLIGALADGDGQGPASADAPHPLLSIIERAQPSGVPDLSANIDHYLYGHPKVTHG